MLQSFALVIVALFPFYHQCHYRCFVADFVWLARTGALYIRGCPHITSAAGGGGGGKPNADDGGQGGEGG